MASKKLYEPTARKDHVSFSVEGQVYLWGGETQDSTSGSEDDMIKLANCIEHFDPYLEVWSQHSTTGTPHPGLECAACASYGENVYMYGGLGRNDYEGVLSCLNVKILTWSQLCPAGTAEGPMGKVLCGMVHFHHDKLAVIGGYGIPSGPTQPGSTFIRHSGFTDGRGWTNEIHVFNLSRGVWFSPTVSGTRPPPCAGFTLISIDNHRAVLFGGFQPEHGRVSDLYLIDFSTMEITKVEPRESDPWPVGRARHAACCLGYAGDHIHLLVTGGVHRDGKALKDVWLFNLSLKKWKEVTLPDDALPRLDHSTDAITLCPELVEVIVFGGSPDDYDLERPAEDDTKIAEITIVTFSQVGLDWELVGVANNSQRGTSERMKEKMLKISEKARAAIDNRADGQPEETASQANKRALEERVEEAKAAVREERARARDAENRAELAERAVIEERERTQEAERRVQESEERLQNIGANLTEERQRAHEYQRRAEETEIRSREEQRRADQRVRGIRQEVAASQERERAAEVRVQEARLEAQQRVEEIQQATEEQLHQAEERVQAAERRSHDLQQRSHDAEQKAHQRIQDTEQRAHQRIQDAEQRAHQRIQDAEQRSHDLQRRAHTAEQHTTAVEIRLHEVEQRARESERRARQAEALVQQSQQESHWLVQQREIELTEEERGRGGWAVVKVANFRGTRVAAKCFYQQILVSRYNRQLFNREMNMAARLRHPNLVQFIGASLEGEPIILTELMTTSLRAELERGPMEHPHITSISLDVARALNYLHLMQPHPIIHRDISSANVLLDSLPGNGWKAKVSDYGSVNLLRELRTVGPGSPVYAAPEASIPAEQSPKMDIFSLGVVLIEMLTDELPIEDARQRLLDSINHAGYLDLIRRCLGEQKEDRPSANEIIAEISEM